MKVAFRYEGTPGYKDFKVQNPDPEATPEQIEDVVSFVGGACRLKDSLAFAEGTILNGSSGKPGEIAVDKALQARLVLADDMNPFPQLTHQVGEAHYRNYPIGGLCPPREQGSLVYFKGTTAGGERWHRKFTAHNMSCWPTSPGLVYTLDRNRKSISVETFAEGYSFPRSLS